MSLCGDPPGSHEIHRDAGLSEFQRPRTSQAELSRLRGDIVREARIAEFNNLASDMDDPPEFAVPHAGQNPLEKQQGRFDEEFKLIKIVRPRLFLDG